MNQILFRRGDVVLVPFSYVSDYTQSKARPAVVIQNDIANQFSPNLILALISSTVPGKEYPIHYRVTANSPIGKASGLERDSIVKTEVLITIPKKMVIRRIGTFPPEAMEAIDESLRISLAV